MITSGEGRLKVFLKKIIHDDDTIFLLGGGEKSHIGGVIICEPGKEKQELKLPGHYDYVALRIIAEAACKKYKNRIVVLGGIHIDNASKEEINTILDNCKELIKCI